MSTTDSQVRRRIPLEGAANFRDLGGYPTADGRRLRWGKVFRSDVLSALTMSDQETIRSLGVRLVCDLRHGGERKRAPNALPEDAGIERFEPGFIPRGVADMLALIRAGALHGEGIVAHVTEHYWNMPREHADCFGAALRRVAEAQPAVIHCTSGKDRTGITVALLLHALGVPKETIFEDYLLTNDYRRDVTGLLKLSATEEDMHILTSARPEYLETAWRSMIELAGSVEDYLRDALGVDDMVRTRLRATLVE
ncbi:MAG: tyrosine-protein phosphatase [Alphaproteobacteria bacterium]|nr:tyrosine-protein phosphatase [Alphaproteobacteria bacterium]